MGLTCAACHTRDRTVDGRIPRIDGGPAFADFVDLDNAMRRMLADETTSASFAAAVFGAGTLDPKAVARQHEAVAFRRLG